MVTSWRSRRTKSDCFREIKTQIVDIEGARHDPALLENTKFFFYMCLIDRNKI